MTHDERLELAADVRAACLRAALEAAEDAGLQGLCAEGRLQAALDAIRSLDAAALVRRTAAERDPT